MAIFSKNIEMEYGAISLDTNVYEQASFKFESGILQQLTQFKKSPVKFLQTEIVHRESIAHIAKNIKLSVEEIERSLNSARRHLSVSESNIMSARNLLFNSTIDPLAIANSKVSHFYKSCGVQLVDSRKYVDMSKLVEMYFSYAPPFENSKDKKSEFPDAIALLSLESWAKVNKTKVVLVSKDSGWENYCRQTTNLICLNDLHDALSKFITHGKLKEVVKYIYEEELILKSTYFNRHIQEAIITSIEASNPEVFAMGSVRGIYDVCSLKYLDHQYVRDSDHNLVMKIVKVLENSIVLKIEAIVNYEVEVNFNFRVRDKSERVNIHLDDELYVSQEEFTAEILLHLEGDFSGDITGAEITNIEIINEIEIIDLGFVGPDLVGIYEREGVLIR
ncbi:PIN domain-containing protein [Cellvibrio sp. NN19]|uniref:PIN domain-containing protein n=1 Tax=Cellvibrio chitinivorans TaxID=3102792 RepID=UPI002B40D58A|nr:PIN domain-containing protein [Cellvibrio sp. NN19]